MAHVENPRADGSIVPAGMFWIASPLKRFCRWRRLQKTSRMTTKIITETGVVVSSRPEAQRRTFRRRTFRRSPNEDTRRASPRHFTECEPPPSAHSAPERLPGHRKPLWQDRQQLPRSSATYSDPALLVMRHGHNRLAQSIATPLVRCEAYRTACMSLSIKGPSP